MVLRPPLRENTRESGSKSPPRTTPRTNPSRQRRERRARKPPLSPSAQRPRAPSGPIPIHRHRIDTPGCPHRVNAGARTPILFLPHRHRRPRHLAAPRPLPHRLDLRRHSPTRRRRPPLLPPLLLRRIMAHRPPVPQHPIRRAPILNIPLLMRPPTRSRMP